MLQTRTKHLADHRILTAVFNSTDKPRTETVFVAVSKKTGKDYTFKVVKKTFKDRQFYHCYVEVGYLSWRYLGHYWRGEILRKGGRVITSTTALSIAWIFNLVERRLYEQIKNSVEIWHTGNCARCGRTLTDVTSIKAGLGPVCITYA